MAGGIAICFAFPWHGFATHASDAELDRFVASTIYSNLKIMHMGCKPMPRKSNSPPNTGQLPQANFLSFGIASIIFRVMSSLLTPSLWAAKFGISRWRKMAGATAATSSQLT